MNIKEQFTEIVNELKSRRKESFTITEMAKYFETSTRKVSQFENGKDFDLSFLEKYCGILGKEVNLICYNYEVLR